MRNRVKKQHIVPQVYLRWFSEDGEHLWAYDKLTKRVFPANIGDIAQKRSFYDLNGDEEQFVEKQLLKSIEDDYGSASDEFFTHGGGRITRSVRQRLARFFVFQLLRTTAWRREIEAIAEVDQVLTPEPYLPPMTTEEIKWLQIRMLLNESKIEQTLGILRNHIWLICHNETGTPLCTSDAPVVRFPHFNDRNQSTASLGSRGVEIALPLSSDCLLVTLERTHHAQFAARDGRSLNLDKLDVEWYNKLQSRQCLRQIYCEQNGLQWAQRLSADEPQSGPPWISLRNHPDSEDALQLRWDVPEMPPGGVAHRHRPR